VLEFAKEHGHLHLPHGDAETRRLSNWLGRQKTRKDVGNSEREKLALLKKYACHREAQKEETWKKFYDQLVEYKTVHGRSVVSKDDAVHKKLSEWIARQRKMKKEGSLPIEREKLLVEIGFVFRRNKPYDKRKRFTEEQEKKWDEMYNKLRDFKQQHGHCTVSYNDENHKTLSKWVSVQRVVSGKGLMDETRQQRLDELNFTWTIKQK
jgi:dsDNA-binding SOS-regulon protein